MRTFEIEGKKYEIRSLTRGEINQHDLERFGYFTGFYMPPDKDGHLDWNRINEGIDIVLDLILGADAVNEIDLIGGIKALNKAWAEIKAETYGSDLEEKNLSRSGNGSRIEGE